MSRHSATTPRVSGFRLLAGCLLLVGLAFVQDAGYLVSDTKFDLAVAPGEFLSRALHLWDAQGAFGQLQNQAYGYLWPMGPFFLLGGLVDLPGWVVQRLWQGLVMSVAFAGFAKLARAIGVRSDFACLLAAFAFALSPRMLTTLGPISIEAWPSALAPWVLLPLVHGSRRGSPRQAAALSALAVAMVGGVNAVATFAVIPLGALWLLTRTPGPRRRALMLWWPLFTALGTLWWLVPLFVMGAYSPPFLDFIETTTVATFPTTVFDALRGTSNWVPYVDGGSRAGNDLITTAFIALDTGFLLFLGFLGLADRRTPERLFLWSGLVVGLLLVTMGHHGSVEGWFQQDLRSALDGALAPLRNVHKFDPIIRVPLVLGLAFVVDRAVTAVRSTGTDLTAAAERFNRVALCVVAVVVVAGAATPAIAGRVEPADPVLAVPEYWTETAAWLEDHTEEDGDGGSLLVPGAPFGEYLWGSPKDEPLQWLAGSPWAVRNVIPLTPPGNIRMLDEVEAALVEGRGSAGLTEYLRRAGVRFLVVRNDLEPGSDVPHPLLVHQAIEAAPGLERVATFGPMVGGGGAINVEDNRVLVDHGWQDSFPAVEVYSVPDDSSAVTATGLPLVVGGPEDLLDLTDLGVLDDQPTELAVDADTAEPPTGELVLTDGLRARERFFGRVHDGYSPALTPGDELHSGNPTRDYLLADDDRWSTTVRLTGATAISASSSESDATAGGGSRRGRLPYAAVDRSLGTAWRSGGGAGDPAWWQLDLDREVDPGTVRLTGGPENPDNIAVAVRTAAGVSEPVRLGEDRTRTVALPDGPTTWIRVEVVGDDVRQLSLADVEMAGLRVDRSLVLPVLPETWGTPDAIVLRGDLDARTGCVNVGRDVRCAPGRARPSEEAAGMSRVVTLNAPATYAARVRVVPRAGTALDQLLLADQPVNVEATSVLVPEDPRDGAVAAIDGDIGTSWLSDPDDPDPTLALSWLGQREVGDIWLRVDRQAAGLRPTSVRLSWPGGTREVDLVKGRASFRPITTDRLSVTVTDTDSGYSVDASGQATGLGVAVSDLRLPGMTYLPVRFPLEPKTYACGSGPDLRIGSQHVPTRIVGSPFEIARGETVDAEPCTDAPVELAAGETTVAMTASETFTPASVVLAGDAAGTTGPAAAAVDDDGPVRRELAPAPGGEVLVLRQNVNAGWEAAQGEESLTPVTVDGWQQGWLLESDDVVVTEFAPDRGYRAGLAVGALTLLALVASLVLLGRRRTPDPAPLEARVASPLVLVPFAVAGFGLVAGWAGVLVAAVAVPVVLLVDRRLPELSAGLFAVPCLAAGAIYALRPWGQDWAGNLAWPHYLLLVSLASALAVLPLRRPRRPRLPKLTVFSRSAGRSTTR